MSSVLSRLFSTDAGLSTLGYLAIRDIFSLAFVSADVRGSVTGLTRKWKYIRARAKAALLVHIADRMFIGDMLSIGRGFVSGSTALAVILGVEPAGAPIRNMINQELGTADHWRPGDIDLYFPNQAACARACTVIDDEYEVQLMMRGDRELNTGPYAINKYARVTVPGSRSVSDIDMLDASIGGPADFYMTMVQNWLWFDGRLRVLDPWAIVHKQQVFTNLCKREVLAQAAMRMSLTHVAELKFDPTAESAAQTAYWADQCYGYPMWKRLNLLSLRVIKYKKRGFVLANDLLQLCRRFSELCKAIEDKYPALVPRPDEETKNEEVDELTVHLVGNPDEWPRT